MAFWALLQHFVQCIVQIITDFNALDGNLVLYLVSSGRAIWASNTQFSGASKAIMQTDGNFVLYDAANVAKWSSATFGKNGAYLILKVVNSEYFMF